MKRFSIALAVAAISMSAMAQTAPNRLFINNLDGYRVSSHVIDRLGDITFGRVDGEVKAEVFVNEVDKDKIVIDVIKSEECEYFKMDILPTNRANQYNDALMANLIESTVSTKYYEDYTDGQIAAADLGLQQSGLYTVSRRFRGIFSCCDRQSQGKRQAYKCQHHCFYSGIHS